MINIDIDDILVIPGISSSTRIHDPSGDAYRAPNNSPVAETYAGELPPPPEALEKTPNFLFFGEGKG